MPSAEEARARNTKAMGTELGSQYSALWQQSAQLHMRWSEYVELFGTKSSRVDLLHQRAGTFFRLVQDQMWEATLLHIARLTDPSKPPGEKANLTIQSLPSLIDDAALKARNFAVELFAELEKVLMDVIATRFIRVFGLLGEITVDYYLAVGYRTLLAAAALARTLLAALAMSAATAAGFET
jgi:AbiU2